jgi:ATP-dependent Zn protease
VEPPDRQGREEILTVHVTKKHLPLAPDVNLNVIAAATAGFTGYVIIAIKALLLSLLITLKRDSQPLCSNPLDSSNNSRLCYS